MTNAFLIFDRSIIFCNTLLIQTLTSFYRCDVQGQKVHLSATSYMVFDHSHQGNKMRRDPDRCHRCWTNAETEGKFGVAAILFVKLLFYMPTIILTIAWNNNFMFRMKFLRGLIQNASHLAATNSIPDNKNFSRCLRFIYNLLAIKIPLIIRVVFSSL